MSVCKLRRKSDATSKEHVIPSALGGVLQVKNVLCTKCNNKCGKGIDATLVKAFDFARMFLDIRGDRGQTVNVRAQDSKLGDIILESGDKHRPAERKPELISEGPDGSKRYRVASESAAQQFINALKKKNPNIRVRDAFAVHSFGDTAEINISLGDEDFYRSCVKSVLALFSDPRWNRFEVLDERAWRYVDGAKAIDTEVKAVLASSKPIWTPSDALGPFYHSISVQSHPPDGALRAELRLFGGISIAIELANAARADFRFGYAVDPCTGQEQDINSWAGTLPSPPSGITTETATAIGRTIREMEQLRERRQISAMIHSMSQMAVDQAFANWEKEPDTASDVVAFEIAEKFVRYMNRNDWEEPAPGLADKLNRRNS